MPVDRCICHKISFLEIKRIADENGYQSIEEIRKADLACNKCKFCEPYIEELLKTGKTTFKPGFYLK